MSDESSRPEGMATPRCFGRIFVTNRSAGGRTSSTLRRHKTSYHNNRKHSISTSTMNLSLATRIAIVFVASSISSSSALLFSPLLLKANPWGVAGTRDAASPRSERPARVALPDYSHDDDLMRYKHELLTDIYEKTMTRGFVGSHGQ